LDNKFSSKLKIKVLHFIKVFFGTPCIYLNVGV